ncbi:rhodanese-like domain-containing protein [Ideonella sp. A 288]|uniref:rhodanese-like domain-containing protein n=1 Tax=Ideonella sp. A 288 TaxID=1962181 RepID=UPI000B4B8398|nr:rhodanese-like domain-containing protein [Ideonella sp. A 288]
MQQLPVASLHAFIRGAAGSRPVLLDVREPWELALARLDLPGTPTVHIPINDLPGRLDELDPAQPILALCHHGMRSMHCVAYLLQQGYADVYNVAGGIDAWSIQVDPSVPRY